MNYPVEEKRNYLLSQISYGMIPGNSHIVLIKTGRGGTVYGENERHFDVYFRLAETVHRRFGCTVIVSDNPVDEKNRNPLEFDLSFARQTAKSEDFVVTYIGVSSGANYGAWYGHLFPEIQRMLLINPIVNLNTHRLKECCRRFGGREIVFLMGSDDPSAAYAAVIPANDRIKRRSLPGEGHIPRDEVLIACVTDFLNED